MEHLDKIEKKKNRIRYTILKEGYNSIFEKGDVNSSSIELFKEEDPEFIRECLNDFQNENIIKHFQNYMGSFNKISYKLTDLGFLRYESIIKEFVLTDNLILLLEEIAIHDGWFPIEIKELNKKLTISEEQIQNLLYSISLTCVPTFSNGDSFVFANGRKDIKEFGKELLRKKHNLFNKIKTSITFTPNVFKIPSTPKDKNLVAIMMPFDTKYKNVFKKMKESCKEVGFESKRVDQIWEESKIMDDIFGLIYRAQIIICDFTGKNPNVFYEAGIAHTLGKIVIPITQSIDDIPFDLRPYKHIIYLPNNEGLRDLKTKLVDRLKYLKSNSI
jgi:hypothetical protein